MNISVTTTSELGRQVKCVLPAAIVQQQFDKRLSRVGKKVRIDGFRPGKIPASVLQERYGASVFKEVISDLIEDTYRKAVTENNLKPVGTPQIEDIKAQPGTDLEFSAKVEVFPEFDPQLLDGITIKKPLASVVDADVDDMVMQLRRSKAQWEDVTRDVEEGDRVKLEFKDDKYAQLFSAQDQTLTVIAGSSHLWGDLDSQIIGKPIDKKIKVKVLFPQDCPDKKYAGKKKSVAVTVKQVEQCLLPELDQKFLDEYDITEGGVEQLKKTLREGMELQLKSKLKQHLENKLIAAMIERNDITVPATMISEEIRRMKKRTAEQMQLEEDKMEQLSDDLFTDSAKRNVHFSLILDRYVETQDMQINDDALEAKLNELAEPYDDSDALKNYYRNDANARRQLHFMVLHEEFMRRILQSATIQETPTSFRDLMKSTNQ